MTTDKKYQQKTTTEKKNNIFSQSCVKNLPQFEKEYI